MVFDTQALLVFYLGETGGDKVEAYLEEVMEKRVRPKGISSTLLQTVPPKASGSPLTFVLGRASSSHSVLARRVFFVKGPEPEANNSLQRNFSKDDLARAHKIRGEYDRRNW